MASEIELYLVRHAESCSNLLDGKITDNPGSQDEQYSKKWNNYHEIIKKTEISNYHDKSITSLQEKIKQQDDKLDAIMSAEDAFIPPKLDIKLLEQEIEKTNNGKLKAYYVKNLMPKYTWLFEPPLSIFGMLQSFQLREAPQKESIQPTFIYASSVMRTIMTAMFALSTVNTENRTTLFICPYINELQNWAGEIIDSDNQNRGNSSQEIQFKLRKFIEWFHLYGVDVYKLFLQIKGTTPIPENIIVNFPRLDFSLLEGSEQSDPADFRTSNTSKFKDIVRKQISQSPSQSNPHKILVFTHGKFIKEMTSIKGIPKNTSITKCSLTISNNSISDSTNWYNPESIRSSFSQLLPKSLFRLNTCSSYPDKLMGMINGIDKTSSAGGKSKYTRKAIRKSKKNRKSKKSRKSNSRHRK